MSSYIADLWTRIYLTPTYILAWSDKLITLNRIMSMMCRNSINNERSMTDNDTWFKCTKCGREGTVGRCCGTDTRVHINQLAKEEQIKSYDAR